MNGLVLLYFIQNRLKFDCRNQIFRSSPPFWMRRHLGCDVTTDRVTWPGPNSINSSAADRSSQSGLGSQTMNIAWSKQWEIHRWTVKFPQKFFWAVRWIYSHPQQVNWTNPKSQTIPREISGHSPVKSLGISPVKSLGISPVKSLGIPSNSTGHSLSLTDVHWWTLEVLSTKTASLP